MNCCLKMKRLTLQFPTGVVNVQSMPAMNEHLGEQEFKDLQELDLSSSRLWATAFIII